MSWSAEWDRIARNCIQTGDIGPLRTGRTIELRAMGMVMFPELILEAWQDGEFGALAYAAEYLANGVTAELRQTDGVLYHHLSSGVAEARRLGWTERLNSRYLHRLEELFQCSLANQAIEGITLSKAEIAQVRRGIAAQHLWAGVFAADGQAVDGFDRAP